LQPKPQDRKNDYGFAGGGPVWIPKLYNGRNKTFWFFSLELFRMHCAGPTCPSTSGSVSGPYGTVPTMDMRSGNFSEILTGRVLNSALDPLGRQILENVIYDPATNQTVNGQVVRNPFPGNIIPQSRFDPVAVKMQALMPLPAFAGTINDMDASAMSIYRRNTAPEFKINHSISDTKKLTGYWGSEYSGYIWAADALPEPISSHREQHMWGSTVRVNYDDTVTPSVLLHIGAGFSRTNTPQGEPPASSTYNAASNLGFAGAAPGFTGFPRITGLLSSFGGMMNMGPTSVGDDLESLLTGNSSVTLVRGNHALKIGAEIRHEEFANISGTTVSGVLNFSAAETALPSTNGMNLAGGTTGFPYASFLLGDVDSASVGAEEQTNWRKNYWGLFLQDTWRATRKLTLDLGIRWDWISQGNEEWYRSYEFSATTPNPSAGGLPGAVIYEGYGPGRCNCNSIQTYPYAVGPRLGFAYQLASKLVLRAGYGMIYGTIANWGQLTGSSLGLGYSTLPFTSPSFGIPAVTLSQGLQYPVSALNGVTLNPGILPTPGTLSAPDRIYDPNAGRPPRINEFNVTLQRQIYNSISLEMGYVGTRGHWLSAASLDAENAIPMSTLQAHGLNIANPASQAVLTSLISSPLAASYGFTAPYAGFPSGATAVQSLRPFPQYSNGLFYYWSPLGKSWYNSLQAVFKSRNLHGLQSSAAFTYSQALSLGTEASCSGTGTSYCGINDDFNRNNQIGLSGISQPLILVIGFTYTAPKVLPTAFGGGAQARKRSGRKLATCRDATLCKRSVDPSALIEQRYAIAGLSVHRYGPGFGSASVPGESQLQVHRSQQGVCPEPEGLGGRAQWHVGYLTPILQRLPLAAQSLGAV